MRNRLYEAFPIPYGEKYANVGKALLVENVFNLVTKPRCYQKPTYETLREALVDMKIRCDQLNVKKLAMPLIGCGLDRLDWNVVSPLIKEVFEDSDIEILICRV